jgi:anti-sigma regulatory factor (Ser/Thr protein kinase)
MQMPAQHWVILAAAELAGDRAPGEARALVRSELGDWVDESVMSDLLLATSEVVTNAVMHTTGPCLFTMCRLTDSSMLRIGVSDTSYEPLPALRTAGATSATGRGLTIVDAVASTWGTASTADGKEVWFQMQGR